MTTSPAAQSPVASARNDAFNPVITDTVTTEPVTSSFFSGLIRTVFPRNRSSSDGTAVLLTAPDPGCGVSFACACIVAELASTIASTSGSRILLCDAQALAVLRSPKTALSRCERMGAGNIWVLGHGQAQAVDPDFYLPVVSPLTVLRALRQEFTHIVIDAPSLAQSNLAVLFATSVAGIVLVSRAGHTESQALTASCRKLTSLGAHVFGSVYNAH